MARIERPVTGRVTFLTDDETYSVDQPDPVVTDDGNPIGVQVEWKNLPKVYGTVDDCDVVDSWEIVATGADEVVSGYIRDVDHEQLKVRTYFWV